MRAGWKRVRLADAAALDRQQAMHAGLPYVGLEDIESGTGRLLGTREVRTVQSSTFRFTPQHVLYGRLRPYLNKVLVPEFDGHCSTEIIPLRPLSGVLPSYLFYWLTAPATVCALDATSTGARMPRANLEAALELPFPLPDVPEQRRIVAILGEAFEGIATAKAHADKNRGSAQEIIGKGYRSIVESLDQSHWSKVTVAHLSAANKGSIRTGPFGSQLLHSEFVDQGIAVLGIDNAVANEFRWDKRRYITEAKFRDLARYRVHPGDVLITIMGTCGRCAVVPDDIPLAINTKHLCCITLDQEKCLSDYLHLYFLHDPIAREYLSAQAKGSIMAGLNMGIIRAECERLAEVQTSKLAALDELKQSLLYQAFSGQL